jgi:hypothetical protein
LYKSHADSYGNCDCDGDRHRISDGDTTTRNSNYANTAASPDTSASPVSGFGLHS